MNTLLVDKLLLALASVGLVLGAAHDWKSRRIPVGTGVGMLSAGLAFLLLRSDWLAAAFYLTAVWGSRGGLWRLPIIVLAIILIADRGVAAIPLVVGVLYTLSIFWMGWFGGGDAQIAMGLVALAGDWWILAYLFGGTILLAVFLVMRNRGFRGAIERLRLVLGSMRSPDDEAIRLPWAVLAAAGGMIYIWVWPGGFWR